MRVILSGGGTGGHIYPALAIADKIKDEQKSAEILYIGTKLGPESDIVPKRGYEFKTVEAKFLQRKISFENIKTIFTSFKGVIQSVKIIKNFKPDIVIGTGGYVCGPVVLAAAMMKIPTLIHEQNAFPGITGKLLSRFVDKIAIGFEEARERFKYKEKIVYVGNPVRKEIVDAKKEKSRASMKIEDNQVFIYSFGGSGGQKSLNDSIIDVIDFYKNRDDVNILHVTGKRLKDDFQKCLEEKNIEIPTNVTITDYYHEAPIALSASDLIIGSAGAITIAEITKLGVASILIPKAYTAENHQEYNARALEKNGAAIVITEKELKEDTLLLAIQDLINNSDKLKDMAVNSKNMGMTNSEEEIFKLIVRMLENLK